MAIIVNATQGAIVEGNMIDHVAYVGTSNDYVGAALINGVFGAVNSKNVLFRNNTITRRQSGAATLVLSTSGSGVNSNVNEEFNPDADVSNQDRRIATGLVVNGHVKPEIDNTYSSGRNTARWTNVYTVGIVLGSVGQTATSGAGSPEGVVTAPIGSEYWRTDGGAGTSRYIKESGTGNTGWVGK
jgi:hypothetical protein